MSIKKHITESPDFAKIVERQMRNWELSLHKEPEQPRRIGRAVQDFVTLSRCVGLPGEDVAARLSERLGWPFFDREILHYMAGNDEYRQRLYEYMDERDLSWLENLLRSATFTETPSDDYFHRLRSTIFSLARKSRAIFLGRAADLILPANAGLRVRLQASRAYCVNVYGRQHGVSEKVAAEQIDKIDHDCAKFIRNHFHVEPESPLRHDIVLNMERLSIAQATDIILAAIDVHCTAAPEPSWNAHDLHATTLVQ